MVEKGQKKGLEGVPSKLLVLGGEDYAKGCCPFSRLSVLLIIKEMRHTKMADNFGALSAQQVHAFR